MFHGAVVMYDEKISQDVVCNRFKFVVFEQEPNLDCFFVCFCFGRSIEDAGDKPKSCCIVNLSSICSPTKSCSVPSLPRNQHGM